MAEAVVTALISTAVSSAISYVLAPDGPDIEGPRLEDRGIQRNSYGTPLSRVYGTIVVTGSLVWLLNDELTEIKTTERQGGKGGGGGSKVTSYSYNLTGTNAVCEGPINGVRRVWADTTLIYDEYGDQGSAVIVGGETYSFSWASGANSQSQDSDESGEYGIDSTPAYRGTALHYIKEMELAEYGNRVPNFQYEVAGKFSYGIDDGDIAITVEKVGDLVEDYSAGSPLTSSDWYGGVGLSVPSSALRFAQPDPNNVAVGRDFSGFYKTQTGLPGIVPPNEAKISVSLGAGVFGDFLAGGYTVKAAAFPNNGSRYCLLQFGFFVDAHVWFDTALQAPLHNPVDTTTYSSRVGGAFDKYLNPRTLHTSQQVAETTNYLWCLDFIGTGEPIALCAYSKAGLDPNPVQTWRLDGLLSSAVGEPQEVQLDGHYDQTSITVWDRAGTSLPRSGFVFTDSMVFSGATPEQITIKATASGNPYQMKHNRVRNWVLSINDSTMFLFDSLTGDELLSESLSSIGSAASSERDQSIWWVGPDAWTDGYSIYQFKTDVADDGDSDGDQGADLQDVVEDLCLQSGLSLAEIDASDLAGTKVRGYAINSVQSLRESLEPLMLAYQFEPFEDSYKLKFLFRDKSSSLTVTEDDMRPHLLGSDGGEFIEVEQIEESKLPIRINVNYLNVDADYEPDTQFAERSASATTSKHIADVSLQMAQTPEFSIRLADKLLREAWVSRRSYKFSLPKKYAYLKPSDVITLNTDDYQTEVRLQEVGMGVDGRMEITALAHDSAVYTSNLSTDAPNNTGSAFPKVRNSEVYFYLIDTNELDFSTGVAEGFYPMYLAGWSSNFTAYQLQQSLDAGVTWADAGVAQVNKATIGYVTSALDAGNFSGVLDEFDSLGVRFFDANPDISSMTDLQVLSGQNIFAVGAEGRWEIIGAATITQSDSYNYTLSRLLRGLKGTEGNRSTMQVGDAVILLNPQTIGQLAVNSNTIGSSVKYRAAYGTKIPDLDSEKLITHLGNPLKEYAPSHIEGRRNTAGDLVVTWNRRTRKSGEWRDGRDVYLAADSRPEEYKVIYKNGDTVLRTVEDITTNKTTYTAAQQSTDSAPSQVTVEVYQVSANGDGYAGTATL